MSSSLDPRTGRFAWMPGPGYLGAYDLVFIEESPEGMKKTRVSVLICPKK
jgi:hypothetical protein